MNKYLVRCSVLLVVVAMQFSAYICFFLQSVQISVSVVVPFKQIHSFCHHLFH